MLGLSGAHGTGKTTLAQAYSEASGIPFLKGTTRDTYKRLGLDPRRNYPLDVRLDLQFEILKDYEALYAGQQSFVTDRTPLDMMAYLLADVQREGITEEQGVRVGAYLDECFAVANRHFPVILIVQPGIPFIAEPGRPMPNEAYQEHISVLVQGLASDERYKGVHFFIPRAYTDMDRRLEACTFARRRAGEKHSSYMQSMKEAGTPLVVH